jgi:hypothetical protein
MHSLICPTLKQVWTNSPYRLTYTGQRKIQRPLPQLSIPFDRTGLYLFELDTNDATITSKGAITHQLETCSVTGDRGFLADDAVHFFSKGKVLSAPWASPNQVSTLTLSADEGDCYFF